MYDIIGDIHGQAGELEELLTKLGLWVHWRRLSARHAAGNISRGLHRSRASPETCSKSCSGDGRRRHCASSNGKP
jgi:hypothetical protein